MISSILKIIEIILILINRYYKRETNVEKENRINEYFRAAIANGDLDIASDLLRKKIGDIKRLRGDQSPPNGP